MRDGMPIVFLKSRRLFLFFKDIIMVVVVGFGVWTDFATPRAIAFEPPAGTSGTTLLPLSARRFFRRRSLRLWVRGFPNPGGTGTGLWDERS
jgi:hypothetical protein